MTPGTDADAAWTRVRDGLPELFAALGLSEVIEFATGDHLHLQVGRVEDEIWLLASGRPTPDLEVGPVDEVTGERLRALGLSPPDDRHESWSYPVPVPADPVHLQLAAAVAVDALRHAGGVSTPADLVWSSIAAGETARAAACRLGIPANSNQSS